MFNREAAEFVLKKHQRKEVLEWFQTLMFTDVYAANLGRWVNLSNMQINGLESHDYHMWIERLFPVMVRGYLLDQLCAKEFSRAVVEQMEKLAPLLLCKLEKIFPPGFFNPMQHMILHLPYEARMGGACSGTLVLLD